MYIANEIHHRLQGLKRNKLANRAKEAELNYQRGKIKSGNVDDLFLALISNPY